MEKPAPLKLSIKLPRCKVAITRTSGLTVITTHTCQWIYRYIKIQPETIDLSTKFREITTEFVGFIPQSLVLRSIVLSRTSIYRNWPIVVWAFTLRNSDILKTHKVLMKRTNSPQSPIPFFSFSNLAGYLSRDLDVYSLFIPLVQCQIVFVLLLFIY